MYCCVRLHHPRWVERAGIRVADVIGYRCVGWDDYADFHIVIGIPVSSTRIIRGHRYLHRDNIGIAESNHARCRRVLGGGGIDYHRIGDDKFHRAGIIGAGRCRDLDIIFSRGKPRHVNGNLGVIVHCNDSSRVAVDGDGRGAGEVLTEDFHAVDGRVAGRHLRDGIGDNWQWYRHRGDDIRSPAQGRGTVIVHHSGLVGPGRYAFRHYHRQLGIVSDSDAGKGQYVVTADQPHHRRTAAGIIGAGKGQRSRISVIPGCRRDAGNRRQEIGCEDIDYVADSRGIGHFVLDLDGEVVPRIGIQLADSKGLGLPAGLGSQAVEHRGCRIEVSGSYQGG